MLENPNFQPDKKGFLWGYIWSKVCSCCSRGVMVSWRSVKPKKGSPSTPRPWKPMLGGTESHSFRWTARRVIIFEILFFFIVRIINKSNQRLWGWRKNKKENENTLWEKYHFNRSSEQLKQSPATPFQFQLEINDWAKHTSNFGERYTTEQITRLISARDKRVGKIHAYPRKSNSLSADLCRDTKPLTKKNF